jgi:penicillin-binding protein 1A
LLLLTAGGVAYAILARDLPDPEGTPKGRDQTTVIYDRNGEVLTKLFAEQNRTDVALATMPAHLRNGVLSTEDQRFYEHTGVDPLGILRALWVDIRNPGSMHGGSTITQQYVKNAFVTPERTITRKVKEAMLAYRIEKRYSKDEILELYLNTIYFGHGAYGVQSAAKVYFDKDVTQLDLAECAMIAGVIKSPGRYSPFLDPEAALGRRATVLGQMVAEGHITDAESEAATALEFALAEPAVTESRAPYFVEYIKTVLTDEYGSETVFRGGLSVTTTLDLAMQTAAESAIANSLDKKGDPSAALVAIDPGTGEILAMVGGRDFATQQYNVAVQGHRQPGSAFKPFVLATALQNGILPEQAFEAGPRSFTLPNGQVWKVTGAGGGKKGLMRLREATEKSVNSVFAQVILSVGADKVVEQSKALGLTSDIEAVPAIALGGLGRGVSPLEMASAYGTLANAGTHVAPFGVASVLDAEGATLLTAEPESAEVLPSAVAYLTTDMLRGVISKGTGTAAKIGRPAAGKTGTTQQYRDAWFVGYTPDLVAAVWVGHPEEQKEMTNVHGRKVTGGSFPAEIWAAFMKAALKGKPERDFKRPPGLSSVEICLESGQTPTAFCTKKGSALFLAGKTPVACELHAAPDVIAIPNLIGMMKDEALALLKSLQLLFKVEEKPIQGVPAGMVGDQTPKYGSEGTTSTVVTVIVSSGTPKNEAPVAAFTYVPTSARANEPVTFDASASTDDGGIAKYSWEFGDGSPLGSGKTVAHTFTSPGKYTVTLWVTDDTGQVSSLPVTLDVK